jgi:hypothetical protein
MSADPHIQHPDNLASYNRYSYVYNTPLSATDPSGYFLKWLARTFRNEYRRSELFRAAVAIAAASIVGPMAGEWALAGIGEAVTAAGGGMSAFAVDAVYSVAAGGAGGFAGGLVASGGDLKAAAQGALTGGAFGFVGASWAGGTLENYAAHAAVGCATSAADGGSCGRGAASQVFSKWVSMETRGVHPAGQMAAATIAGGTVSVITGGKFANGAKTAAFGYLFNCFLSPGSCRGQSSFEGNYEPSALRRWWNTAFGADTAGQGAITASVAVNAMVVDTGGSMEYSVGKSSDNACFAVKGCVIQGAGAYVGVGAGLGAQSQNLQSGRAESREGVIMGGTGPAADVSFQVENNQIVAVQRGIPRAGIGYGGAAGAASCIQQSICLKN